MTDSFSGNARPNSLNVRRNRPRRGALDEHQIIVIDGLSAGERHGCVYREVTAGSASLLVRADIRIGQRVRVQPLNEGVPSGAAMQGEIVRSRPLSGGRYDLLVEFPRQTEAPKPSESQRRHERRLARLGRPLDTAATKPL